MARPNLDISPNNPAFEILRRVQSRSSHLLYSQNFPQSLSKIWPLLIPEGLSQYDRQYLANRHPFGERPLLRYRDSIRNHSIFASPLINGRFSGQSMADSAFRSGSLGLGLRMFGSIKERLTYYTHGKIYTEWVSEELFSHQFDPDFGETCAVELGPDEELFSERTCNRFEYYLKLDLDWLEIKAGRDHLHMGPGYFTSLTAHKNTPPYYLAEVRLDFSNWFVLDNYFLKMTDSDHDVRKFAHIHRFEFKAAKSLCLAFQDAVIYQERHPDLAYILPLIPLAFSEDNTGGRDNDAMSLDVLYTGIPFASFWGEVFIDDLLAWDTFFDDFWENRWAVLAGFQVVSPLALLDADLVVEYSRVEPWTYNGRQDYTSFRHFNVPSASQLGPDSRTWDFQLSVRPLPWLAFKEHIQLHEKGTQRGAGLGNIHSETDETKKVFLRGEVNSTKMFHHVVEIFWRQYFSGIFYFKNVIRGDICMEVGEPCNSETNMEIGGECLLSW